MSWEDNYFLFLLIEESLESKAWGCDIHVSDVMFWGMIFGDGDILADWPSFGFDAVVEFMILGFVVAGAPVMEVAVDAVFNLDMH